MAAIFSERYMSRQGTREIEAARTGDTVLFQVVGAIDDADAEATATANIPPFYLGRSLVRWTIRQEAPDVWRVDADYAVSNPLDYETTFDTTGGTTRLYQSKATTAYAAAGAGAAPDFKNAVGVNGDTVEGVEVGVRKLDFSIKINKLVSELTGAYTNVLHNLTYTTNNAVWRGFQRGEVLFRGATGSYRVSQDPLARAPITFHFSASPNAAGLTFGDIQNVSKKGWEYIWFRYKDAENQNQLIKRATHAYVERTYDEGDFTLLGLGT